MALPPVKKEITFKEAQTDCPIKRYKAPCIPQADWERYYPIIYAKRIQEDYTLDKLKDYMRAFHEFEKVTKKQFRTQFAIWKFSKDPAFGDNESNRFNPRLSSQPNQNSHIDFASRTFHLLSENFFGSNGEWPLTGDSIFIRRAADFGLFFLSLGNSQALPMILDRLKTLVNDRPGEQCPLQMQLFYLSHSRVEQESEKTLQRRKRLVDRSLLTTCAYSSVTQALSQQGRTLLELILWALRYLDGDRVEIHDLPKITLKLNHAGMLTSPSIVHTIHENCRRHLGLDNSDALEPDWSSILLGLHPRKSRASLEARQIDMISGFVQREHVGGISKILNWIISVLDTEDFLRQRIQIIESCCLTVDRDYLDLNSVKSIERCIMYYYLVSSYWGIRGQIESELTWSTSEHKELYSVFQKFLNEFALTEYDILQHLAGVFVNRLDDTNPTRNFLRRKPRYLEPGYLNDISTMLTRNDDMDAWGLIANWWLQHWLWDDQPSRCLFLEDKTLATILELHILSLLHAKVDQTHPFVPGRTSRDHNAGRHSQLQAVDESPELEQDVSMLSPTITEFQLNRSSTASSDLAAFQRAGSKRKSLSTVRMDFSTASGDLPSKYCPEAAKPRLKENLRLSGSSSSTASSGRYSTSLKSKRRRFSAISSFWGRGEPSGISGPQQDQEGVAGWNAN